MAMSILVDTNEAFQSPKVIKEIEEGFKGVSIIKSKLNYGDILIVTDGITMAIERKAPYDLLASIGDGRLFRQAENMVTNTPYSFFVVHGSFKYSKDDYVIIRGKVTKWRGRSVRSAIRAIQLAGCVFTETGSENFADTLHEIVDLVMKPDHKQKPRKMRAITFPPSDSRVDILSQFDGVGRKRANAILEFVGYNGELGKLAEAMSYGTMMELLNEDSHPEGWGKGTIKKFRESLGLVKDEYITVHKEVVDES